MMRSPRMLPVFDGDVLAAIAIDRPYLRNLMHQDNQLHLKLAEHISLLRETSHAVS
jgi:hypothetical protein